MHGALNEDALVTPLFTLLIVRATGDGLRVVRVWHHVYTLLTALGMVTAAECPVLSPLGQGVRRAEARSTV